MAPSECGKSFLLRITCRFNTGRLFGTSDNADPILFRHEHYSHIILVPLVSASLFILERRRIFSHVETYWAAGLGLLFAGALFYCYGERHSASLSENDQLFIAIFSAVVILIGGFVLCYGFRAFRVGLFPLLFLFLTVPIPDFFLDRAIFWLQTASAEVSYAVFQLVGIPVFRTGFIFALPGLTIEIAKECSGIHSSLALLITSLLAGHLFLRSPWKKALLTLEQDVIQNAELRRPMEGGSRSNV